MKIIFQNQQQCWEKVKTNVDLLSLDPYRDLAHMTAVKTQWAPNTTSNSRTNEPLPIIFVNEQVLCEKCLKVCNTQRQLTIGISLRGDNFFFLVAGLLSYIPVAFRKEPLLRWQSDNQRRLFFYWQRGSHQHHVSWFQTRFLSTSTSRPQNRMSMRSYI